MGKWRPEGWVRGRREKCWKNHSRREKRIMEVNACHSCAGDRVEAAAWETDLERVERWERGLRPRSGRVSNCFCWRSSLHKGFPEMEVFKMAALKRTGLHLGLEQRKFSWVRSFYQLRTSSPLWVPGQHEQNAVVMSQIRLNTHRPKIHAPLCLSAV